MIQGNSSLHMGVSLSEALFVVSQKWSFPTNLPSLVGIPETLAGWWFSGSFHHMGVAPH